MLTKRLEKFIESLGITIHAFEVSIGVSNTTLRKAIENEKSIGSKILEKIFSEYPQLSFEWLVTGRGGMLIGQQNEIALPLEESPIHKAIIRFPKIVNNRTVPILDAKAAAGDPFIFDHPDYFRKLDSFSLPASMFPPGNYASIQVRGDSMADTLTAGDFVLGREIESLAQLKAGEIYIIIYQEDSLPFFQIKRCYYYLGDDEINLRSDNASEKLRDTFLPVSSLLKLYRVEARLTTTFTKSNGTVISKVERLEGRLKDIEERLD